MNNPPRVLLDSDFLIALYKPDDTNHAKAKRLFSHLLEQEGLVYLSSFVLAEATTVMSYKCGMEEAKRFYTLVRDMADGIIPADEKASEKGWSIFLSQTKKGTSYVDCLNKAMIDLFNFDGILSFDAFYPSLMRYAG